MIARITTVLLAASVSVAAANAALAQASAGLRCIANPDVDCVIELAERSFVLVPEDRWHLVLPNLTQAMFYSGRTARGQELAQKIEGTAVRRLVNMVRARVLFHEGKVGETRAVLDRHAENTSISVGEVTGWALDAYERGAQARGDAAIELANDLLDSHKAATGEKFHDTTLPSAVAASGDTGAAIDMVNEIPDLYHRAEAATLLVEILANGPDEDRARSLLHDVKTWRASLDPVRTSQIIINEAWAWLQLDESGQALAIANEISDARHRDSTLSFLVLNAGMSGNAENALVLAAEIERVDSKAWALAECALLAYSSGHRLAAATCLERAREPVSALMEALKRGETDPDLRFEIDGALTAAAQAESLAGNDAAVVRIVEASGIFGSGISDQIIAAHINAGDYSLAMLLAFQGSDALKQAKAMSSLARALAKKSFIED